mgnify:CR=1 FL=1
MIMTFNELKITDPILKAIGEKGYLAPTPIQQKGIPVALDGRDMPVSYTHLTLPTTPYV